jgi:Carboxypeptidase regulatory-like domain
VRVNFRVFLAVLLLILGSKVLPQSPDGSIRGIVLDPDAKAIPDAEIIVVNDVTGVQYQTKTNGDGIYNAENLPPGPYRIQVSKFGFKAIIKPDITINVQDALLLNFTLEVGASSVVVTVEGGAPMVNTTDASVSTVVDRQFAENLPLNGRSFQSLIFLTPGVVVTPSTSDDNGQFSVNGQRPASNYWTVDGVGANVGIGAGANPANGFGGTIGSFSTLGGTNSLVSIDAMQEFRVQTSTFAPEFGRTPGGQISIVTRSGTNRFHGTLFDYFRNDAMDANDWFANEKGLPKPKERQNDFGGTLGGPILKDKTFFFFSYEGLRLRLPETTLSNVPDLRARANAVPGMQPYLNAFPLPSPNAPDNAATGEAEFNASYSNPGTLDASSIRIDHQFNNRWSLFGRYNYSPSELSMRGGGGGTSALSSVESFRITTQTLTLGTAWAISPSITNDFRFNYSRTNAQSSYSLDSFGGAVPLTSLPFPASYTSQDSLFGAYIFSLGVGEFLASGRNAQNIQRQLNVVDSLSIQTGRHSLKFGVDFRRLSPFAAPPRYEQLPFFSDVGAAEAGQANFGGYIGAGNEVTVLLHNIGSYAQDSWRVLPRLTMTYGVRWDLDFAPSSASGPALPAVVGYSLTNFSNLAIAPAGTPAYQTTYGNVAPRFGAAYQISQNADYQTVVRGGFGVFYDLASAEIGTAIGLGVPPFGQSVSLPSSSFPYTPAQAAPPPIPSGGTLSEFEVFNPHLKLPYTLEWNVALEQALGKEQTLTMSYVGADGHRLLQTVEVLSPPTNPDILLGAFVDNAASSNYNALQIQYQRRISHGLEALASYTWSHSIDNASASSFGNHSNLGTGADASDNRGSSDFDIRHAFTGGFSYAIPAPQEKGLAQGVLGGWSVQSFLLARSATPVDLTDVHFTELNGGKFTNIRPDVIPGMPLYVYGSQCIAVFGVSCPGGKGFNPAAFTDPPRDGETGDPLRQGDLPRNALRGFGAFQWDFALHRDFPLHEGVKLQFRAELFNILNHPNFGPPYPYFGATGFGLATQMLSQNLSGGGSSGAGGFNPLYQIGGPRSCQLALKITF